MRSLLSHVKDWTREREVLEYVATWARSRHGGAIPSYANLSGRSLNARAHDALAPLLVETGEVTLLRGMLIERDESHAHRPAKEDIEEWTFGVARGPSIQTVHMGADPDPMMVECGM